MKMTALLCRVPSSKVTLGSEAVGAVSAVVGAVWGN